MQPLPNGPAPSAQALSLVPAPASTISVESFDGTLLHTEITGPDDAPTIVLAHGITCSLRAWHYQVESLSRDHRVVTFDQRGHGRSGRPRAADGYSVTALGHDLQAVLTECAGDRPVVLAGHSMGGMSVMAWAAQYPDQVQDRVAAAALICTAASDVLSDTAAAATPLAPVVARRIAYTPVRTPIVPGVRGALRWLTFGVDPDPRDVSTLAAMINGCPGRTRSRFARSLASMDLLDALEHLTVPTVVLGGQRDRLLPIGHSRDIADRLPDLVEYRALPGVGHMAQFESQEYVSWRLADLAERFVPTA